MHTNVFIFFYFNQMFESSLLLFFPLCPLQKILQHSFQSFGSSLPEPTDTVEFLSFVLCKRWALALPPSAPWRLTLGCGGAPCPWMHQHKSDSCLLAVDLPQAAGDCAVWLCVADSGGTWIWGSCWPSPWRQRCSVGRRWKHTSRIHAVAIWREFHTHCTIYYVTMQHTFCHQLMLLSNLHNQIYADEIWTELQFDAAGK